MTRKTAGKLCQAVQLLREAEAESPVCADLLQIYRLGLARILAYKQFWTLIDKRDYEDLIAEG